MPLNVFPPWFQESPMLRVHGFNASNFEVSCDFTKSSQVSQEHLMRKQFLPPEDDDSFGSCLWTSRIPFGKEHGADFLMPSSWTNVLVQSIGKVPHNKGRPAQPSAPPYYDNAFTLVIKREDIHGYDGRNGRCNTPLGRANVTVDMHGIGPAFELPPPAPNIGRIGSQVLTGHGEILIGHHQMLHSHSVWYHSASIYGEIWFYFTPVNGSGYSKCLVGSSCNPW